MFVVCVVVIVSGFSFLDQLLKLSLSTFAVNLVAIIFQRTRSDAMSEVRSTRLFICCYRRLC